MGWDEWLYVNSPRLAKKGTHTNGSYIRKSFNEFEIPSPPLIITNQPESESCTNKDIIQYLKTIDERTKKIELILQKLCDSKNNNNILDQEEGSSVSKN